MTLASPDMMLPMPARPRLKDATPLKDVLAEAAKARAKEPDPEPLELFDSRSFLSTTPENSRLTLEVLASRGSLSKMFEQQGKEIREAPDATDHQKALGYDMEIAGATDRLNALSAKHAKSRIKDTSRENQIKGLSASVKKLRKEREELSAKNSTVKANQLETVATLLGADAKSSGENPYGTIKAILTEATKDAGKQAELIQMLKGKIESGETEGLDPEMIDQLDSRLSTNRKLEKVKSVGKGGLTIAAILAFASTIMAWFAAKASKAEGGGHR